jgi:hypothetical protein
MKLSGPIFNHLLKQKSGEYEKIGAAAQDERKFQARCQSKDGFNQEILKGVTIFFCGQ